MEQETSLRHILLKSLSYENGKWLGELELVIIHNGVDVAGFVPFMYDRTWHLHAFKYPKGLNADEREGIKQTFHETFKAFSSFTEQHFFQKRETFGVKPSISSFEIQEDLSNKEGIYATFTLEHIREVFFINIQLINNIWHYKLHSKHDSIESYKTFYTWEDAVFEQVIEQINQHHEYRLRFVVHGRKFKYK